MTEQDHKTMDRYNISHETSTTYLFAGHKYQRLEDAVNFAKNNQHLLTAKSATAKDEL